MRRNKTEISEGFLHPGFPTPSLFSERLDIPSSNRLFVLRKKNLEGLSKRHENPRIQLSSLISGLELSRVDSSRHGESLTAKQKPFKVNASTLSHTNEDISQPRLKMIKLKTRPSRCLQVNYRPPCLHKSHTPQHAILSTPAQKPQSFGKSKRISHFQQASSPQKLLISHIAGNPFKAHEMLQQSPAKAQSSLRKNEFVLRKMHSVNRQKQDLVEDFNEQLFGTKVMRQIINAQKRKNENKRQEMSEKKFKQIRLSLIAFLHHLHKLKLTPLELVDHKVFPDRPYESKDSRVFFQLCKMGKTDKIQQMLEKNKYLVYEFDHLVMTTLHWAAIRGSLPVAQKLLQFGADPDAQDIVGRTPLYMAFTHNHNELASLILMNRADPWNKINLDYLDSVVDNPEGKQLLSQSRKVWHFILSETHILLRMTPPSQRKYIWQKEQLDMLDASF